MMTPDLQPQSTGDAAYVQPVEKTCPRCGSSQAYFTGITVLRETPDTATMESEVRYHYCCAATICRHTWRT